MRFNLSKFGQRERILAGIVLLALEVAAFYHFLIKPQFNDIRTRRTELSGREELLEAKRSKLRLLNQLEKERLVLKTQSDAFRKQFFCLSDIHELMKRCIQYADENDSRLLAIDYKRRKKTKEKEVTFNFRRGGRRSGSSDKKSKKKKDIEEDNIFAQSIKVVVRGYYENLINIVSHLETYEKLTSVSDLKVAYSIDEPDKLEADITLNLHFIDDTKKDGKPENEETRQPQKGKEILP